MLLLVYQVGLSWTIAEGRLCQENDRNDVSGAKSRCQRFVEATAARACSPKINTCKGNNDMDFRNRNHLSHDYAHSATGVGDGRRRP